MKFYAFHNQCLSWTTNKHVSSLNAIMKAFLLNAWCYVCSWLLCGTGGQKGFACFILFFFIYTNTKRKCFQTSTQSASKKLSVVVVIRKQKHKMKSFKKSRKFEIKHKKIREEGETKKTYTSSRYLEKTLNCAKVFVK